jgi:hypothetical protein
VPPLLIVLTLFVIALTAALAWAIWRIELRGEEKRDP